MEIWQILVVTLIGFLQPIDDYGPQIFSENKIFYGAITGLLLGDLPTGLFIGASCHLMSLGVVAIGGSSVPNYNMAAIVGTAIAISTGQSMETGVAIGTVVGMCYMQLEVLHHIICGFIAERSEKYCDAGEYGKMSKVLLLGPVFMGLAGGIPVFVACSLGVNIVNFILDTMPAWFSTGLSVAGGALPAVGMAMLLNYMPVKQYFGCLLVGFVLATYAGLSVIPVAIAGGAWAFETYKSLSAKSQTNLVMEGELEDE